MNQHLYPWLKFIKKFTPYYYCLLLLLLVVIIVVEIIFNNLQQYIPIQLNKNSQMGSGIQIRLNKNHDKVLNDTKVWKVFFYGQTP